MSKGDDDLFFTPDKCEVLGADYFRIAKPISFIGENSGIRTTMKYDRGDDVLVTTKTQNVTPILEHNKMMRNEFARNKSAGLADSGICANIPISVITKWKDELGVDFYDDNDMDKVDALLNSDYKYLKTTTLHL